MAAGKLGSFDNFKNLGEDFIGRKNELAEIRSYFSKKPNRMPRVLIIHALAGQGKTQIALEYCRQSQEIYGGIFWFNATSDMAVIGSFEKIATELQLASSETLSNAAVMIRTVKDHLESWKERWLIVFDNYDKPEDYPDTKRLIPSCGRGDVIFTSRNKWLIGDGRFLEIPPMKSDEGLRLLLRGRGYQDIEQHKVGWLKVVRRLGGLALALDQARAYLRYKNISIEASTNFLATYEAHRNAVLQNMPRDFWESKRTQAQGLEEQNMAISAFTTWEMLFQEVEPADQQRKNYIHHFLTLSAFFEPSNIGESIFQCRHQPVHPPLEWMNIFSNIPKHLVSQDPRFSNTKAVEVENPESTMSDNDLVNGKTGQCDRDSQDCKWDHARFWDLIWQLQNEFSLLRITSNKDTNSSSFSLHPLIRDWIQVREPAEKVQFYTYEAIDFVHASVVAFMDTPTPADQQRLVLTHLDACIWNDNQFTSKEYRLGHHPFNFYIASSFSHFYKHSGRASASLELSSAVMETRKQVLGKDHRHTLIAIEQVASLYVQQARWKEAEDLQEGVIATKEKIFGSDHLETVASRVMLADIYINQRRQKEAENLLLQVLEKRKKLVTKEHVNTTLVMTKLALVYEGQQNWREAIELCSSVVEMQTKDLGAGHPHTLATMTYLARLYVYQGKRKEAEDLEVQVRETWNQKGGVAHAETLESAMKSPSSLVGMGQEEAEELFEQERDATKRIAGAQLSDTERIRNTLLANKRGFMKETKELLAQGLVLKESVMTDEHSEPSNSISMDPNSTYSALNQNKREIRLLTLLCSGGFEDDIRCKLDVVSLDETLTYTALSYCWGNQNERREILVNEKTVSVTKSLEIALRYARKDLQDMVLWVDAICINQENLKEKSYQVGMMGSIYATATHVRIWLGESDDDSDVAMDFINNIHTVNFEDLNYELDFDIWKAVKHLVRRQWWTRVWIIQECFLAKKPKFYCGRKAVDRESFTLLIQLKSKYRVWYSARLRSMQSSLAGPFTYLLENWDEFKSLNVKGALNLTKMIIATTENHCSEPVDKIFALLSMCKDLDRQAIKVDYTLSARQLSIMVAKYQLMEIETHNPLFILQRNLADKDPTLPSWVPDYTQCTDDENHILSSKVGVTVGDSLPFAAGADNLAWTSLGLPRLSPQMNDSLNSITLRIEDEGSFETLVLHGLILDVITAAFRPPWEDIYNGSDLEEDIRIKRRRRELMVNACKEWEAYVKNLPVDRDPYEKTCTRYHAFWRTLITEREINPLGPPSPDSDLAARFEAWMGRGTQNGKSGDDYEEYIRDFNQAAVPRCMYRSFLVTERGYIGLGSRNTVASQDHVCVLRGGTVPFILRKRTDGYWGLVGEAYVHGIMDGEFVRGAKKEDLRVFRIR